MSHRSMGLFELLNGKSLLSGKTKGANGRTKSIPEGYDGKFINPKKARKNGNPEFNTL